MWFLFNGPHGPSFTWGQTRREPAGHVGLEHLQRFVAELQNANPMFMVQIRDVVNRALGSPNAGFLRRASWE